MKKRFMLCALGASAAALVVLGAAAAAGSGATKKTVTFHLIEKDAGFNFIDNPPRQGMNAPPLIGDQIVFSSVLQNKAGAHAGWLEAQCTFGRGGTKAAGPCLGVYALQGGTLMVMAAIKFYGPDAPTHIVVVGGTGVYQGATGSILSVTKNETTNYDTVTLTWS